MNKHNMQCNVCNREFDKLVEVEIICKTDDDICVSQMYFLCPSCQSNFHLNLIRLWNNCIPVTIQENSTNQNIRKNTNEN